MKTIYLVCGANNEILLSTEDESKAKTFKLSLDLHGVKNYFTYYTEKIKKSA